MVEEKSCLPTRRFRLRQLKKILPSDRISIEKNFPRFHEKCQSLKRRYQQSTSLQVQDLRNNDSSPCLLPPPPPLTDEAPAKMDRSRHTEIEIDRVMPPPTTTPVVVVPDARKVLRHRNYCQSLDDLDRARDKEQDDYQQHVLSMADHLEEITLQRGCWLQARLGQEALSCPQFFRPPRIVYSHRKKGEQVPSRVQLTLEVIEEFDRQKRMQLLVRSSSYHASLPIFNRASIHLHTRRVS